MKVIKRSFLETCKRFLSPFSIEPLLYIRAFIIYSLWGLNPIIHIVFLEKIIKYIELGDKVIFKKVIFFYIAFIILYEILEWLFRNFGWTEVSTITQKNIHKKYVKKYVELDNTETEKIGTGKVVSIIETGLKEWGNLIDMTISMGLSVLYTLLFTIYMVFKINYFYGLLFIIIYILIHIFSLYMNIFVVKYRNERIEEKHNYTKLLVKIIMSKFEILQSGKIDKEINKLDKTSFGMLRANRKMVPYLHSFFRAPILFISIIRISAFVFLGYQIIDKQIPISILVGVSGALILMSRGIEDSVRFVKDITKEFSSVTKMWDFFDSTPEIQGYETGKNFIHSKGNIEIKNLTYGYTPNIKIFNNFNLNISGGKVTALVGLSGSGKSTLVKLISGYIRADSGKIVIDNQNLNEVSLKTYYKDIGYLTQEPSVFDGTILENLTYALENENDENNVRDENFHPLQENKNEVGEADIHTLQKNNNTLSYENFHTSHLNKVISLAKCEFIHDLPNGIDTEIGERGVKLSGGQRQRLAIAKIFLKNPKIIILDEPTSALDSFSEELITKAMHNLFKDRTVIIIAHRLQTVKHADEIILLEDGQIKERGTHKELVKNKGIYNRMLELQSGF